MNSNYEWQRFRANEWAQERRREAEAHRLVKRSGYGRFSSFHLLLSKAKMTLSAALKRVFHKKSSRTVERERLV